MNLKEIAIIIALLIAVILFVMAWAKAHAIGGDLVALGLAFVALALLLGALPATLPRRRAAPPAAAQ